MRPYPEELQRAIQAVMMSHFAPEITSAYSQRELGIVMLLFSIMQRDYDTAVPDLIDANAQLRALLGETADALARVDSADARKGGETLAAVRGPSDSLRLSTLRAERDALRGAVSALAPWIEPAADVPSLAPMREVRAKIFAHLAADAKRRSVPIFGG